MEDSLERRMVVCEKKESVDEEAVSWASVMLEALGTVRLARSSR